MYATQFLAVIAVVSSFTGSFAVVYGKLPIAVTVVLAGLPGCAIGIDRGFNFMRQSRWHYLLATELRALVNALEFEGNCVEEVSAEFSRTLLRYKRDASMLSFSDVDDGRKKA